MTMTPLLRKFVLTAHVTSSVGWLGAVAGFLVFAVTGLTSQDVQIVRAAYLAMELTRLVRHSPVKPRLDTNRTCPVTGYRVGLVSALLDPGEIPDKHLCLHRLAVAYAAT